MPAASRAAIRVRFATLLAALLLSACDSADDPSSGGSSDLGDRPSTSRVNGCVDNSVDQFEELYGPPTAAERATMREVCSASAAEIADAIEEAN